MTNEEKACVRNEIENMLVGIGLFLFSAACVSVAVLTLAGIGYGTVWVLNSMFT